MAALRDQKTDIDWEIVVVLDGTPDSSREVLRRFESDLPLRVVENLENRGRPAALNAGFRAALGDILVRCDDDLIPSPLYVSRHADWHRMEVMNGIIGLYVNEFPDTPYARTWGRYSDDAFRARAYDSYHENAWRLWAGNTSVHRSMFERVGPYDEEFRSYGWEDSDWGYRLLLAGGNVRLDPGLETIHRSPATTTALRVNRAFQSGEAHARFVAKHGVDPDVNTRSRAWSTQAWNAAVNVAAMGRRRSTYESAGRVIDSVLPRLPNPVGRRLVGMTVEAAALAGFRGHIRNPAP